MDDDKRELNEKPAQPRGFELRLGAMRGEIEMLEGWEKSLSAEEADAFWEGREL